MVLRRINCFYKYDLLLIESLKYCLIWKCFIKFLDEIYDFVSCT